MKNIIDFLKYISPLVEEFIKYVIPLTAVFMGWLLARKSESDKIKYSELRQVRKSLFVLLEIRNQVVLTKRVDRYMNVLEDKLNLWLKNHTVEKIERKQLNQFFEKVLPNLFGDGFQKDLKEQFNKCVDNLSEINPVLAYTINGKQNVQDYIKSSEDQMKSYLEIEKVEDIKNAIEFFKSPLVDEIKKDIESIIEELAQSISKQEVKGVKQVITEPKDEEIEAIVNQHLEAVLGKNYKQEQHNN